jgi:hypothetical protein
MDDSSSLTASDFELLNSECFFDKFNDAFQTLTTKNAHTDKRHPSNASACKTKKSKNSLHNN